jgi:hypothetical protein
MLGLLGVQGHSEDDSKEACRAESDQKTLLPSDSHTICPISRPIVVEFHSIPIDPASPLPAKFQRQSGTGVVCETWALQVAVIPVSRRESTPQILAHALPRDWIPVG